MVEHDDIRNAVTAVVLMAGAVGKRDEPDVIPSGLVLFLEKRCSFSAFRSSK